MSTALRKAPLPSIPVHAQSVYSGQNHLGWTHQTESTFQAIRPDRTLVGSFETVAQARAALQDHSNG